LTVPLAADPSYSVSQLCDEIHAFLGEAFPSLWVVGEVQRLRRSQRGHLYFELVEKGEGDQVRAKLDAVAWRSDAAAIAAALAATGQQLADGIEIRCWGGLDFYGGSGRLQLVVRQVDPVFGLGLLARRRQEVLAELVAAGLVGRNKALPLAELPLALGLITSVGSAAYHDFLTTLAESGYGFRVVAVHAAVQGKAAERQLQSAFAALAGLPLDAVVLVRGGGSRTDLAVFDSREVALAVAGAAVPVLTGLGHEIDESIADRVAHTALKTPTKAAEYLVARVAAAELAVVRLGSELRREALAPLARARETVAVLEGRLGQARGRLALAAAYLAEIGRALCRSGVVRVRLAEMHRRDLATRLAGAAPRRLTRERSRPEEAGGRLAAAGRGHLRAAQAQLAGFERLCAELSPRRTLERGFSLTRDGRGALIRQPAGLEPGVLVTTETAGGTFRSRVEAG
jgi:exodeoxyribonuclease VII large subunit